MGSVAGGDVLLRTLEAVDGGLSLLEVSVVLDVLDVRKVLEVLEVLEMLEMLEVLEAMCCLLLRLLEMLEVDGRTRDDARCGQKSSRSPTNVFEIRTPQLTLPPENRIESGG